MLFPRFPSVIGTNFMENTNLYQAQQDLVYAHKYLRQVQLACRNDLLNESERKSNEGVRFGSCLFQALREMEAASQYLSLLIAYRNPSEHKIFLEKLRQYEDPGTDYSGSILPALEQED